MFLDKNKEESLEKRLKEIKEKITEIKFFQNKTEKIEEKINQNTNKEENVTKDDEYTNVPLFIKLDKYRNIVSSLVQLKNYLNTLNNSLIVIEQIEKARLETLNTLSKTLEKMNEKLEELEKSLIKPAGFTFGSVEGIEELSSVQTTLSTLKSQIEELKAELEKT